MVSLGVFTNHMTSTYIPLITPNVHVLYHNFKAFTKNLKITHNHLHKWSMQLYESAPSVHLYSFFFSLKQLTAAMEGRPETDSMIKLNIPLNK